MSILKIARMGHPVLREKARKLKPDEFRSPDIRRLIDDMIETMEEYDGIGLAAPQVYQPIQLALIKFDEENARYPDMGAQPLLVIANPKTTVLDKKVQAYWEGCLSVPGLRGLVHRPRKVQIDFLDFSRQGKGKARRIIAEGFLATVFQHELDHLEGKLYVDRLRDTTKLSFIEEYAKHWEGSEQEAD